MKNKDLDRIIKEKLNQANSQSSNPDWNEFMKILKDQEGFEDLNFDQSIREKAKTKVPFNENHWHILRDRLQREEQAKKKLITSQIIEGMIVFLMLFLYQQYDNYMFNQMDLNIETVVQNEKNFNQNTETTYVNNKSNKGQTTQGKKPIDIITFSLSTEAYIISEEHKKALKNEEIFVERIYENQNNLISPNVEDKAIAKSEHDSHSKITPLTTIIKPMALSEIEPKESVPFFAGNLESKEKETEKYITPVVSGGIGIVKSGYDKIYNLKAYSTYSSQMGIGALYSLKNDRMELQTGLKYTRRSYKPEEIKETYAKFNTFYDISLDKINYDIVEIPFDVKYHIKDSDKFKVYTKLGVSANFALRSQFNVIQESLNENRYTARLAITDGEELDNKAKLSKKDFNPGLLQEGGKFSKNTFLTLTGEIGMEKKITDRASLTMGLEYNKYYMIDGIGPNKDKLNALNLNLGMKTLIN